MDHAEAVRIQATEKYLLGSLGNSSLLEFEEHFFECEICAEDVRTAVFLADNASAEFKAELAAAPETAAPDPVWQRRAQKNSDWRDWFRFDFRQPAFIMPLLALVVVSALWIGDHRRLAADLTAAGEPQLITNVPLDTARGEKPVSVTKDERYFAVSFYIDQDTQPAYAIQISGNGVAPATIVAASRPVSYSVLLPVARYKPGRYDFKVFAGRAIDGPLVKQFALTLE